MAYFGSRFFANMGGVGVVKFIFNVVVAAKDPKMALLRTFFRESALGKVL